MPWRGVLVHRTPMQPCTPRGWTVRDAKFDAMYGCATPCTSPRMWPRQYGWRCGATNSRHHSNAPWARYTARVDYGPFLGVQHGDAGAEVPLRSSDFARRASESVRCADAGRACKCHLHRQGRHIGTREREVRWGTLVRLKVSCVNFWHHVRLFPDLGRHRQDASRRESLCTCEWHRGDTTGMFVSCSRESRWVGVHENRMRSRRLVELHVLRVRTSLFTAQASIRHNSSIVGSSQNHWSTPPSAALESLNLCYTSLVWQIARGTLATIWKDVDPDISFRLPTSTLRVADIQAHKFVSLACRLRSALPDDPGLALAASLSTSVARIA